MEEEGNNNEKNDAVPKKIYIEAGKERNIF